MKIRIFFVALCLLCAMPSVTYGQQSEGDCQLSTVNCQFHKVPPRKEIRHKIKQLTANGQQPEDNCQLSIVNSQLSTRASGEYIMKEFPTEGEVRGLVLLVAYKDIAFSLPNDSIRTLLQKRYDGDNYTEQIEHRGYSQVDGDSIAIRATIPGSARDYFRDQSFGQFVPRFDVVGPVTLDNPRAYYGANTASGSDKNAKAMITEACRKAYEQQLTDFSNYDGNGDGVVDFVYVVYAGSDEAQTGIEECVWAHAHEVSLPLGDMAVKLYACSGELFVDLKGLPAGIGTFVHEFSHILGLPDFYNTDSNSDERLTMDAWSVMDYGMYNRGGFVPCAYTAFERYSLGWVPMETLNSPATMSIGTTDAEGKGYRIFTSETEADTASFYLIETIRKEGWNSYANAEGMLISEVTYDATAWEKNDVNVGTAYRHRVVPANNQWSFTTNYNPAKHLFGITNHEFTRTSTPASITQFGVAMDKPLTDIHYNAQTGKTSFHFCGGNITDGIGHTESRIQDSELIYDLQGRPVTQPSHGLYIQNGKKYLAL